MATSVAGDAFGVIGGKAGEYAHSVVGHSLFGAVVGGVVSNMQGGNFWEGAAIGLTVGLLNHAGKKLYPAFDRLVNNYKDGLKEFYAIVAGESTDNTLEAQGIGEVVLRRLELVGKSISKGFVKHIGGEGQFDAIGGKTYNEIMKLTVSEIKALGLNSKANYNLRIAGATLAISNPQANVSNGAYFWNATSQKNWKDIGFNWRAYNNGTFQIAAEIGKTTFFKYNNSSKHWP